MTGNNDAQKPKKKNATTPTGRTRAACPSSRGS
jgi:hypothetical protein